MSEWVRCPQCKVAVRNIPCPVCGYGGDEPEAA